MRFFVLLGMVLLLAGCGVSAASTPTPTPTLIPTLGSAARFRQPPPMTIDQNHRYSATIVTNEGTFTIELLPKVAPIAVNNFVFLARHHYYDNIPVHRIIADFMIQTGDPTGTGYGGPGYVISDEPVKMSYSIGTVAMANVGRPNSAGSQFFIVTGPRALQLPKSFTIFGRVSRGLAVVMSIARTPVTKNLGSDELSEPLTPVILKRVVIQESK